MTKNEIYFATRKTASAHVHITKAEKGKEGSVRINNVPLEMIGQETAREVMLTPLEICGEENRNKINVSVRVSGGGFMGQAYAVSTAISRALIGWTKNRNDPKEHPFTKSVRSCHLYTSPSPRDRQKSPMPCSA